MAWQDALYPDQQAEDDQADPFAPPVSTELEGAPRGPWLEGEPPPWAMQPEPAQVETPENVPDAAQPVEAQEIGQEDLQPLPWEGSSGYQPQLIDEQLRVPQAYGEFGVEPETVAAGAYQRQPDQFAASVTPKLARPKLSETLYPDVPDQTRRGYIQETLGDDDADLSEWSSDAIQERINAKREAAANDIERRQKELALRIDEARQNNLEARRKSVEDASVKMDEIRNRRTELYRQESDPDRWWGSRSTGQKAAAYIAAALQGWLNPGGRNSAIDLMQGAIRDDIALQERNLSRNAAMLGEEEGLLQWHLNQGLSLEAAKFETEAAGFKQYADAIAADAAKFDQGGTSRETAELARRQALAEAAKAEQAAREAEAEKLRKQYNDELELDSKLKTEAMNRANTASMIKERKDKTQIERDKLAAEQADKRRETELLGLDQLGPAIARRGGDIKKDRDSFAPVVFPDGSVEAYRTKDPDKVKDYFSSAKGMGSKIDQLLALRVDSQWDDKVFRTKLSKQAKAVYGMLKMDAKNFFDLGAITEADAELIEGIIAGNPDSWRDMTDQLKTTRALLEEQVRQKLIDDQVPRAQDFRFINRSPAGESDDVAADAREQLRGAIKVGAPLSEYRGAIDNELRRFDEEGYSDEAKRFFLERALKDASDMGASEAANYVKGLMR